MLYSLKRFNVLIALRSCVQSLDSILPKCSQNGMLIKQILIICVSKGNATNELMFEISKSFNNILFHFGPNGDKIFDIIISN